MATKKIPEHPYVKDVRRKVELCRGYWPEVAEKSGVSKSWIVQFARLDILNPTIGTLQLVNRACDEVINGAITVRGR